MDINNELKEEYEFYLAQKDEWKESNKGKYVIIKNKKIDGVYEKYEDALQIATKKYVNEVYLIQEVGAEEEVNYITHSLLGVM